MKELDAAILESTEAALNLYLDQRILARQRINSLADRSIRIDVSDANLSFILRFTSDRILVSSDRTLSTDAKITGQLRDLLKLLYQPRSVLFGQGVQLEGDVTLVQKLQKALADIDLDWEVWLSKRFGDLGASAILSQQRSLSAWATQTQHNWSQSLKDYLQDEIHLLPSRIEYEIWSSSVDSLTHEADRLSDRIEKLRLKRLNNDKD